MAAAPRSTHDFDDRAELLRARLREARAEADPTSPEAMARADALIGTIALLLEPESVDISVGDDGSIDLTCWFHRDVLAIESAPSGVINTSLLRRSDRSVQSSTKDTSIENTATLIRALSGRG